MNKEVHMQTLYFVLYLLAFVAFAVAAFGDRFTRRGVTLVPVGLALVTLVWMLQALNRL